MIQLICLFSPAFLAVSILQKIGGKPIRGWDFAYAFAISAGVVNMLSTAVLAVLFGGGATLLTDANFSAMLVFKYLALSFALAMALPYTYDILCQIIKIELSIRVNPDALAGQLGNAETVEEDKDTDAENE